MMFRDRRDAASQLAARLKARDLHHPLVLAIPRGGVIGGATLARELGADLDVVLSRKLPAPGQPELALGAVAEDGNVFINSFAAEEFPNFDDYIATESRRQFAEIQRRQTHFRGNHPAAPMQGRSVIVTDDGIATGATMIAALQTVRAHNPREIIVATACASPDRLEEIRRHCDDVVCLTSPTYFHSVGQFYEDFRQIEDEEVIATLTEFASRH